MCIRDRPHTGNILATALSAVSYTHLDVYKRQGHRELLQIGDQLVRLEEREIRNSSGDYERRSRCILEK